jgi:hypothetical protein
MFSKCSHPARFMADRAYSARKGTGLTPAGIRAPVRPIRINLQSHAPKQFELSRLPTGTSQIRV